MPYGLYARGETSGEIRLKTRLLSEAVWKLARWLAAAAAGLKSMERGNFPGGASERSSIRWNIASGDPAGR